MNNDRLEYLLEQILASNKQIEKWTEWTALVCMSAAVVVIFKACT